MGGWIYNIVFLAAAFGVFLILFAKGFTAVINWLPAIIVKLTFSILFPEWKNRVELNYSGLNNFFPGSNQDFVSNKKLRQNGKAAEMGIPTFTWSELQNNQVVNSRLNAWADSAEKRASIENNIPGLLTAAFGATAIANFDSVQSDTFNSPYQFGVDDIGLPQVNTNGMPMIPNSGIDVQGHVYGHQDQI